MGRGDGRSQAGQAPARSAQIGPLRARVAEQAERVAELGEWPGWIDRASLTERVPEPGRPATGFDAGVACTLDLIPRQRQKLAARLHAAYTPDAVAQARREAAEADPDSETTWWLAACSICEEGELSEPEFLSQVERFKELVADPAKRLEAAQGEYREMLARFDLRDGVPVGTVDGAMQGAYLAGHEFAVMHAEQLGIYFLGTYHPSLGLEDFNWSERQDEQGRALSGPVHGSQAFVKCADSDELERALDRVRSRFSA